MAKDIFDKHVHEMLHSMEANVPVGAWDRIVQGLQPTPPPGSMGFATGAVAAVVLMGGLAVYSAYHEPFNENEDLPQRTTAVTQAIMEAETTDGSTQAPNKSAINFDAAEALLAEGNAQDAPSTEKEEELAKLNEDDDVPPAGVTNEGAAEEPNLSTVPNKGVQKPMSSLQVGALSLPVGAGDSVQDVTAPSSLPAAAKTVSVGIQISEQRGFAPFEVTFKAFGIFDHLHWDFGPLGKSDRETTFRTFERPGTYTALVTAFDASGTQSASEMVTIEVLEGSNLVVPDSFTPNNDGINDSYKVQGLHIESFYMAIVDARGRVVFESNNIDEGWHYQGIAGNTLEAHFAVIKATGIDGKQYSLRQPINILF